MKFYVYMVECIDKTYYTGYSNDVVNRVKKHNSGKGAKYTRSRLPVKLVFSEEYYSKSEAMKWEYVIKHFTRKEKEELIDLKRKELLRYKAFVRYCRSSPWKIDDIHIASFEEWKKNLVE